MLSYSPISSAPPGGKRDYVVDFSGLLADDETLTTSTVTALDSSILQIQFQSINASDIDLGGCTVLAGKGVSFTIQILRTANVTTYIDVFGAGNSNTSDTIRVCQPIEKQVSE